MCMQGSLEESVATEAAAEEKEEEEVHGEGGQFGVTIKGDIRPRQ